MPEKRSSDVKNRIFETTKALVKARGNVTIKDIAEACYINIAAVNYHFGSKDELLNRVMESVIDELKSLVQDNIAALPKNTPPENALRIMLDFTYDFAVENVGVITQIFLEPRHKDNAGMMVLDAFFSDTPFTHNVFQKLAESTGIQDEETLRAKYLLLFSSFAIPLFLQILDNRDEHAGLKNPAFKGKYINELIKILV